MFDLTDRCALVTGASGDIGAAIARGLLAGGARVALSGTRVEALQTLADALGERAVVAPGDLSSAEGADQAFSQAEQALGQIDILVNNAGMTRDNLLMRLKDEDFARVLEVNLMAAMRLSRAAVRGMMKRRWGRIVAITSVVGFTGNPGQTNYAASKAGLVGFVKSLAAELAARGITANCIAPGFIASAMTDALSDDQKARISGQIPSGRMGSPDDIAAAVRFLASHEAGYVTGETIHVNGGMAMI